MIRGDTQSLLTKLIAEACCNCGVMFGLDTQHQRELLRSRNWFYCPNGHRQHYIGTTDAERAKQAQDELARERSRHDQTRAALETKERQRRAAAGQTTRLRNRVKAGVCIECNRSFANLRDHMATKHAAAPETGGA